MNIAFNCHSMPLNLYEYPIRSSCLAIISHERSLIHGQIPVVWNIIRGNFLKTMEKCENVPYKWQNYWNMENPWRSLIHWCFNGKSTINRGCIVLPCLITNPISMKNEIWHVHLVNPKALGKPMFMQHQVGSDTSPNNECLHISLPSNAPFVISKYLKHVLSR